MSVPRRILGRMSRDLAAAYRVLRHGSAAGRLAAVHAATDPEVLAVLAPLAREQAAVELVHAVLDNPACPVGVAARYATHPDPAVRLRVARWPGLHDAPLIGLAQDRDAEVAAAATARLAER